MQGANLMPCHAYTYATLHATTSTTHVLSGTALTHVVLQVVVARLLGQHVMIAGRSTG